MCEQAVQRLGISKAETSINSFDREFFQLIWLGRHRWKLWRYCDGDSKSASTRLPCCFSKRLLKRDFLHNYLTTFLDVVISEIQNLWGSSLFSKYLKLNLDFKNEAKNWGKVFCFWNNCIWIGIVKLSLLTTGYFSSAAIVLTRSQKILQVLKRDFF